MATIINIAMNNDDDDNSSSSTSIVVVVVELRSFMERGFQSKHFSSEEIWFDLCNFHDNEQRAMISLHDEK